MRILSIVVLCALICVALPFGCTTKTNGQAQDGGDDTSESGDTSDESDVDIASNANTDSSGDAESDSSADTHVVSDSDSDEDSDSDNSDDRNLDDETDSDNDEDVEADTGGDSDSDSDRDDESDSDSQDDQDDDSDSESTDHTDEDTGVDTTSTTPSDSDTTVTTDDLTSTDSDANETPDSDLYNDLETYCAEAPTYDATGNYEVLRPEDSQFIHTSDHFVARWNNDDNVPLTDAEINAGLEGIEEVWNFYMDVVGFPPPYVNETPKYKVSINISDEGYANGAGTGDKDPEMWVHFDAFRDVPVLSHEFAHTLQFSSRGLRDSDYVGWAWESHAEWMRHQYYHEDVLCAEDLVNGPHLYYGSTRNRYCNWQFWEFLKDKYCYRVLNDLWAEAPKPGDPEYRETDPFSIIANNLDWSASRLNDEFGDWALHNATWDYTNGEIYRQRFGSYDDRTGKRRRRVTQLEAMEGEENRYAVSEYWAPQRWGYNLVRLIPQSDTDEVSISFRGVVQDVPANTNFGNYNNQPDVIPHPNSEWRWGVVALEADDTRRYSPLQRGTEGEMAFSVKENDKELWLAVVATPSEIQQIFWDQIYYTIYRYPWMVEVLGAWPEGFEPNAPTPTSSGAYHENGGGWVDSSATVASTAYVGPYAMVLGGRVSENARIEDHAVVIRGTVSGNAVVGGLTLVDGGTVSDSAEVVTVYNTLGNTVSGTAQMRGDMELHVNLSSGVYYGFVDSGIAGDSAWGANRTDAAAEVTLSGPFSWY